MHDRRVNFERGCRINGQKGTNVEHSFQNNNIQKIFLSVITYQIKRYIYMCINIYIYIFICYTNKYIYNIYMKQSKSICVLSLYE